LERKDQYTQVSAMGLSNIGLHLLQKKKCANNYNKQQFSILTRAFQHWKPLIVHRNSQIISKYQKEFVYYSLQNFRLVIAGPNLGRPETPNRGAAAFFGFHLW